VLIKKLLQKHFLKGIISFFVEIGIVTCPSFLIIGKVKKKSPLPKNEDSARSQIFFGFLLPVLELITFPLRTQG